MNKELDNIALTQQEITALSKCIYSMIDIANAEEKKRFQALLGIEGDFSNLLMTDQPIMTALDKLLLVQQG